MAVDGFLREYTTYLNNYGLGEWVDESAWTKVDTVLTWVVHKHNQPQAYFGDGVMTMAFQC